MLEEAGLPRFASTFHDPAIHEIQFAWGHGLTLHMDLTGGGVDPIDDSERAAILGLPLGCEDHTHDRSARPWVRGGSARCPLDSRSRGHQVPPLHPDDVTTHIGLRVTSPSRTLIDLAEVMSAAELRATFARARKIGLLDPEALRAARARVEWRPSLEMLDEVIEEFCG